MKKLIAVLAILISFTMRAQTEVVSSDFKFEKIIVGNSCKVSYELTYNFSKGDTVYSFTYLQDDGNKYHTIKFKNGRKLNRFYSRLKYFASPINDKKEMFYGFYDNEYVNIYQIRSNETTYVCFDQKYGAVYLSLQDVERLFGKF